MDDSKECCEGLIEIGWPVHYQPKNENTDDIGCVSLEGSGTVCSDCGNGICEDIGDEPICSLC